MNIDDDRVAAGAQRQRARRALVEAEAALARLHEARARAEALLRRGTGERTTAAKGPAPAEPEEALRRRMREIEDRMQETDARMRHAEADVARIESDLDDGMPPGSGGRR